MAEHDRNDSIHEEDDRARQGTAADPEAEWDNSLKAETSSSLLYLGFGVPLAVLIATGIFGVANGHAFLAYLGFGVSAILIIIAIVLIMKLVRANRGRSHH